MKHLNLPEKSLTELLRESNRTGVQFMMTELNLGLSLLAVADRSSNPERERQLCFDAKRAYDALVRFLPRFDFSESQEDFINTRLDQLRARLRRRGFALER